MSTNPEARAWLRVRGDALLKNYARLRASVGPDTAVIPMVKADAYGLGMAEVVRALSPERPWGWGVATLSEGLCLRELGVTDRVVIFSPLVPEEVGKALRADLQLSVSSRTALDDVIGEARQNAVPARVHVDVDTGMGRTGFDWGEASEWMPEVAAATHDGVEWVGCFTHLHSADEDEESVREQWARFEKALGVLGDPPRELMVHALNSAGALRTPEYARHAIRPGIFLYGGAVGPGQPLPEPVVSLHARVCHVRDAGASTTLGYGATYRASSPERWATLSIGYGDGLPRALGNRGVALVGGHRVPIIGRISMDLTVVDISDAPGVGVGDIATLLGADGREQVTLDEVAELAGTISYEVLTGFSQRLPRIWT